MHVEEIVERYRGGGPCADPRGKPVTGEAGRFDRHPGGIYTDPTAGRRLSGR